MRAKRFFSISATAIVLSGLFVAGAAISFPAGVPVSSTLPFSCTTQSGWTVSLVSNSSGSIPFQTACAPGGVNAGKVCSTYRYTISGSSTPDHVLVTASADQDLDSFNQGSSASVPGAGDSKTDYLKYAQHEYPIRLNPTPGAPLDVGFVGASTPRLSTVLITKGKTAESCLIAGPGVAGDPFQPISQSQTVLAAGGKCQATLIYDAAGRVSDITTNTPGCFVGSPTTQNPLLINGTPLKNNTSPHGITFGNGTTTCYGPPVPSVPRCICTAAPCP